MTFDQALSIAESFWNKDTQVFIFKNNQFLVEFDPSKDYEDEYR